MTAIEKPGMLWKQVTPVTNGASNTYHKIKGQYLIIQLCLKEKKIMGYLLLCHLSINYIKQLGLKDTLCKRERPAHLYFPEKISLVPPINSVRNGCSAQNF